MENIPSGPTSTSSASDMQTPNQNKAFGNNDIPLTANPPESTNVTPGTSALKTATSAAGSATGGAVTVDEEALRNQKLVEEFQYLLEKSQSLFSGLRDLPPNGSHRQWRPYFEKTFEVYTKLWKFQQTHRQILENKTNYGLKRWEVGEIASKIGQLYYHYYLRTSETNYLHEAYVFYEAIHERQYFKDVLEVKNPALMIKKMRYYARFVVVCLLLNKDDAIRSLVGELEGLVSEYTKVFKPADAKEWQLVLDEINTFMEAEKKLVPIRAGRTLVTIEHRLPPTNHGVRRDGPRLRLQEAILVGNYQKQIKFSELTLDMYRMLQSLERQPMKPATVKKGDTAQNSEKKGLTTPGSVSKDGQISPSGSNHEATVATHVPAAKRANPHKYLLYRPSLSQLMVYIATAYKDTADNAIMLLYLSADGCLNPERGLDGYRTGLSTNLRRMPTERLESATTSNMTAPASSATAGAANTSTTGAMSTTTSSNTAVSPSSNAAAPANVSVPSSATSPSAAPAASTATIHGLFPADLVPFSRKPLFLIVDSPNSNAFHAIPNVFNQPLMCLMSPVDYPSSVQDRGEIGSLFTLFLHVPLLGFCSVSDIGNLDQQKWDECQAKIAAMEAKIGDLVCNAPVVDPHIKRFMTDDFLWTFIVRFILCGIILRSHLSFKDHKYFPTSVPSIPESIYDSSEVLNMFHDLTSIADVRTYFAPPPVGTPPTTSSQMME